MVRRDHYDCVCVHHAVEVSTAIWADTARSDS
jgi:hypothetical protein